MPTPRFPRPKTDFSRVPNPATLPPEVKQELLAQPWFRKVIKLHMSGVPVTPEMMEAESKKPLAMGLEIQEYDFGNGQKMKGLVDTATGEFIPPEKLVKPEFRAKLQELFHPSTGESEGTVLQTSPSSAVPWQKTSKEPLLPDEIHTVPVRSKATNSVVAEFVITPGSNELQLVKKDKSMTEQMLEFEQIRKAMDEARNPGANPLPATAPAQQQAKPASNRAPDGSSPYTLREDDDFYRVPVGKWFRTPDGRLFKKVKEVQKPQPSR